MKMTIKKKAECNTAKWSGGTTTELFLYPHDGSYARREFQVRISSAVVELEESTFTSLPGVERWLMTLKGSMKLCHKDHYERDLAPYEVETFMGDWETKSYGKVVDMNLMLNGGAAGEMCALLLPSQNVTVLEGGHGDRDLLFLYVTEGSVSLGESLLTEGDIAIIEEPKAEALKLINRAEAPARVVVCEATYNK